MTLGPMKLTGLFGHLDDNPKTAEFDQVLRPCKPSMSEVFGSRSITKTPQQGSPAEDVMTDHLREQYQTMIHKQKAKLMPRGFLGW